MIKYKVLRNEPGKLVLHDHHEDDQIVHDADGNRKKVPTELYIIGHYQFSAGDWVEIVVRPAFAPAGIIRCRRCRRVVTSTRCDLCGLELNDDVQDAVAQG